MSRAIFDRVLRSPEESSLFAQDMAQCFAAGDCVLLSGGIGAGKTHFARGIIQSLLVEIEDVPSPTFTLVQTYETRIGTGWHADLYRLADTNEVFELGLLDAFGTETCFVEWPDRLGADAPKSALSIEFQMTNTEGERRFVAMSDEPAWTQKLAEFIDD